MLLLEADISTMMDSTHSATDGHGTAPMFDDYEQCVGNIHRSTSSCTRTHFLFRFIPKREIALPPGMLTFNFMALPVFRVYQFAPVNHV